MDRRSQDDGFEPNHHGRDAGAGGEPAGRPDDAGEPADGIEAAGDAPDGEIEEADEAARLEALIARLRTVEREMAAVVLEANELAGAGVAERVAGQPLTFVLGVACRQTGADRGMVATAGDVLDDMPVLRSWFADGNVSWGEVRAIAKALGKRSKADRGEVDQRLAATFPDGDGPAGVEPDELIDTARAAAAERRHQAEVERDQAEGIVESFVSIHRDLFGGVCAYGELDPVTAAGVLTGLEAACPTPTRNTEGGEGTVSGWSAPPRSRELAAALHRVCAEWTGGFAAHPATSPTGGANTDAPAGGPATATATAANADTAGADVAEVASAAAADGAEVADGWGPVTGRRARPLLTATVDVATASGIWAGTLDLACRGPLPRLTAAVVEALMCDASVQAVVCDGARPLATTAKLHAADIPTATRTAVEARDRGCRWPGCDAPLAHCDIHHIVARELGGTHHPDNLVCLCRADHVRAHRHGWTLHLDGDTGVLTGQLHGRPQWATSPRATPLAQPPDKPPAGDDEPPGDDGEPPPGWGHHTDNDGNPLPF